MDCNHNHFFSKLEKSLQELELNYIEMRKDINTLTQSIDEIKKQTEFEYQKLCAQYAAINEARLQVIQEQSKALKAFQGRSLRERIKAFYRPKIGCLYHYEPRPLKLAKRYQQKLSLAKTPVISIVTPVLNHETFIERTILSVLNQHYPALEYIIQDGGSKDKTMAIIKRYQHQLKHFVSRKDNGQSQALNFGFKHASGEIMAYLNSDDLLMPNTLKYIANYFNQHPNVDVVYGHRILIDEYDQEVGRWVLPPHHAQVLTWADYIPQETLFWRKSLWDKVGGCFDESYHFALDWELLLRFQKANAKFARLPRFLGAFRIHPHQKTSAEMKSTGISEMRRLRQSYHGREIGDDEIKKNITFYLIHHLLCHKLYKIGLLRY